MTEFKLAVLCPSRGRPELAKKMQDSFPCDVFFYLNQDDPRIEEYDLEYFMEWRDSPIAYSTNLLWTRCHEDGNQYDAYMFCGDDAVCKSPGIIESIQIASCAYPHGIWAMGVNDGREKGSFPHPIVSKKWADVLGYVVPPIFYHWHIDTYTERLARQAGVFSDLSSTVTVEHQTPKAGKNPVDDTFRRIRKGVWHDRDQYVASFKRYLEADLEVLKCQISS